MSECKCDYCKSACKGKPGWFRPGEPEKVAEYLGISLQELFDEKLGVDWYENTFNAFEETFVLAPATKTMSAGSEYNANPHGECVFFDDDGLCEIHPVKPYECKIMSCTNGDYDSKGEHKKTAVVWTEHQDQIEELLGQKPTAEVWLTPLSDMLNMLDFRT